MRDIKGYEGLYAVTEKGKVWAYPRKWTISNNGFGTKVGRWKSASLSNGYPAIRLHKDGKSHLVRVHRILAETFIPNPNRLPVINHINGDKTDFRLSNLEWCSSSENASHAIRNGLRKRSYVSKLCEQDIKDIRQRFMIGEPQHEIAQHYNVDHSTISRVCTHDSWKCVK
jgi:hypothetical protein